MPTISRPAAASERIAVSRPEPGPFTNTSTRFTPCSIARRAAASAASCAANGVDLREPLNPTFPLEAHEIVFPIGSVIVTMVLLNVDWMCACACGMFFFSLRFAFFGFAKLSPVLLLRADLLGTRDRLLRTLARARVRVRALPAHR